MDLRVKTIENNMAMDEAVVETMIKNQDKFELRIEAQLSTLQNSFNSLNDLIIAKFIK